MLYLQIIDLLFRSLPVILPTT